MHPLVADVRLALRGLRRNPGFAVAALLTIALGVGANTAVFTVVNAFLIRALPYRDPDRLVAVFETAHRSEIERRAVSYLNFRDWERDARSFAAMSVVLGSRVTMTIDQAPERLFAQFVSGNYFDLLGIQPVRGRVLTADDSAPGAAPVAVISHAFWQRVFNGDPAVIGRAMTIDGRPGTIVGIVSDAGGLVDAPVVWAPIERFAGADLLDDRGQRSIDFVIARLAPGVTIQQARAELDTIAARIDREHPSTVGVRGAGLIPLREEFVGPPIVRMLWLLLGAVGFVLLIACVNVAGLLLARGTSRQSELAVRSVLGAPRGRLIGQLMSESVVLSVLGGALGLGTSFLSVDLLVAASPIDFPGFVQVGIDARVVTFTALVCLTTGLLSGVAPALTASRTELLTAIRTSGRDGRSSMFRRSLVAIQIALAVVLLVGAALMIRTLTGLNRLDPGFDLQGLVTFRLVVPDPPGTAGDTPERLAAFSRTLLEQVRALPGVRDASLSSDVPLGTSVSATNVRIDGTEAGIRVYRHLVSPGHFKTIGAPLLAGRDFTADDDLRSKTGVAVVSRALANRHFPAGNALHQRIWRGERLYEIVGVVDDLQHRQLLEPDSADPDLYLPLYQVPAPAFAVLARTSADPQSLIAGVRRTVATLNSSVPVFQIESGAQLRNRQTAGPRFVGAVLGAFALAALALTMIGIYGVTAYTVSRQTRQVGIRMALGATTSDVLRLVLSGGLVFIAIGLVLGTFAALGLTRLMSSFVYGVSATDPATFAAVLGLLAIVAVLACLIPAIRAARIDPLAALRTE